ncbi:hypothetical protein [Bradyrhizobium valentinum]|uniref:Uncharacterized protein n=1 Tax=Bradyrhizobium valentinum TaxID=1518501 RepID=A0A0R3L0J7_9BRAD|nr:hypothetical protein [Bradyrhizobium valentinum]KRQ97948.1 hypothetical protein CP49_24010 [Bradyrhizobium valentinum]KRR01233.1 hypothetical protein CQ10_21080 [Bradyrhizobium valentinum]
MLELLGQSVTIPQQRTSALSQSLRLSRILSEIWRESENVAHNIETESVAQFVRRDISFCSEALSFDLPG